MASSLEQDIRSCLAALAADAPPGASTGTPAGGRQAGAGNGGSSQGGNGGSGSQAGATAGVDHPTAWLLMDLEQLLPPGCHLAGKLQSDEMQLCKELEAADRSPQRACRMAARMLAAIGSDGYSSRQLAQLLCQSDAMLQLCLQAVQAEGGRMQQEQAAGRICEAAWQVFAQRAAALEAAQRAAGTASDLVEAAAKAARSLHVATRLTFGSEGMAEWALGQHGTALAGFFSSVSQGTAGLPEDSKAVLTERLAWCASTASKLAHKMRWSSGGEGLAAACLHIAGVYLAAELPRFTGTELNYRLIRPQGPAAGLAAVLSNIAGCATAGGASWHLPAAAQRLLAGHAGSLVRLLAACLLQPPAQLPTENASKVRGAAETLVQLCTAAVDGLAAASLAGWASRHSLDDTSARQLEAALSAPFDWRSSWLNWLPRQQQLEVQSLCRQPWGRLQPLFGVMPAAPGVLAAVPARPEVPPAWQGLASSGHGAAARAGCEDSGPAAAASLPAQQGPTQQAWQAQQAQQAPLLVSSRAPARGSVGAPATGGQQAQRRSYAQVAAGFVKKVLNSFL